MPGDLLDDVKAAASDAADNVRRAFVVKTVIALGVFYALTRGNQWRR